MSPLLWTCRSAARLTRELRQAGRPVSERTVNRLLHELGFSLQANHKTLEGKQHPDRDGQFRHLARRVLAFQRLRQPVISVDCKKKELLGRYRNGGREWRPQGCPEPVNVHDFMDQSLGKAIPYGVYDVGANVGWVSVGVDHDTAEFAVETLRRWWWQMGVICHIIWHENGLFLSNWMIPDKGTFSFNVTNPSAWVSRPVGFRTCVGGAARQSCLQLRARRAGSRARTPTLLLTPSFSFLQ